MLRQSAAVIFNTGVIIMQSESEVLAAFAGIVAKSLHVPVETVTMDSHLDDLGAESLDLIEITMATEEQFNIYISEKSILQTAGTVFGPGVLERGGVLTEDGKALLRARMPDVDASLLEGEVQVKDVNKYFLRIASWVRLIQLLARETPTSCAACGGALEPAVAMRLKCTQCGTEVGIPSGEDINRRWVQKYRESLTTDLVAVGGEA
jgi:acyl carrier protein